MHATAPHFQRDKHAKNFQLDLSLADACCTCIRHCRGCPVAGTYAGPLESTQVHPCNCWSALQRLCRGRAIILPGEGLHLTSSHINPRILHAQACEITREKFYFDLDGFIRQQQSRRSNLSSACIHLHTLSNSQGMQCATDLPAETRHSNSVTTTAQIQHPILSLASSHRAAEVTQTAPSQLLPFKGAHSNSRFRHPLYLLTTTSSAIHATLYFPIHFGISRPRTLHPTLRYHPNVHLPSALNRYIRCYVHHRPHHHIPTKASNCGGPFIIY